MSIAEDAGEVVRDAPRPDAAPTPAGRFPVRVERGIDVLIGGLLAAATFFVHDVRYMLTVPLWTDELWVAISTRLPLHDLLRVTSSSPPGWTLLLRMVPYGYPERIRIVPLMFAALTVVAAYVYARSLPWPTLLLARIGGILAGVAALLVPSVLIRNDLKQYTADAFVTIVVLYLISRLESQWTGPSWSRRLVELAVFIPVGFLFSTAAIIVGAAAWGSVFIAVLIRRDWRRLLRTTLAGAACMACLLVIYLVVYRPGAPPGLTEYWADYYVPVADGWGPSWDFLVGVQTRIVRWIGMGPALLVLGLLAAGIATLVRLRRVACALAVPVLVALMIVLSAARQYPLFDVRTAHFLTVALAVTAAIGAAGLCALAARLHAAVAVGLALLLFAGFAIAPPVREHLRAQTIPKEDLGTPTQYIADHLQPGDTVVVPMMSSWGFAYYWPHGEPTIAPVTSNLQQFIAVFPDQPFIMVATDGRPAGVDEVMTRALERATGPEGNGRIWFVHVHVKPAELAEYRAWAEAHGIGIEPAIPNVLELLTVPEDS